MEKDDDEQKKKHVSNSSPSEAAARRSRRRPHKYSTSTLPARPHYTDRVDVFEDKAMQLCGWTSSLVRPCETLFSVFPPRPTTRRSRGAAKPPDTIALEEAASDGGY
jgi:hypothetical protein